MNEVPFDSQSQIMPTFQISFKSASFEQSYAKKTNLYMLLTATVDVSIDTMSVSIDVYIDR